MDDFDFGDVSTSANDVLPPSASSSTSAAYDVNAFHANAPLSSHAAGTATVVKLEGPSATDIFESLRDNVSHSQQYAAAQWQHHLQQASHQGQQQAQTMGISRSLRGTSSSYAPLVVPSSHIHQIYRQQHLQQQQQQSLSSPSAYPVNLSAANQPRPRRSASVPPPLGPNEREGWIVAMDTKSGMLTVEHFHRSKPLTAVEENSRASSSSSPTDAPPPTRYTFHCPPAKMLQARIGTRVVVVTTPAAAAVGAAPSNGPSDLFADTQQQQRQQPHPSSASSVDVQLRIPQPKRERERHGVITRVIHKGMCVVECDDVIVCHSQSSSSAPMTSATATSCGSEEDRFSRESFCLLWSSMGPTEVAKLSQHFRNIFGERSGNDMFYPTNVHSPTAKEEAMGFGFDSTGNSGSSSDPLSAMIGVSLTFSAYPGTSVVKRLSLDFSGTAMALPASPPPHVVTPYVCMVPAARPSSPTVEVGRRDSATQTPARRRSGSKEDDAQPKARDEGTVEEASRGAAADDRSQCPLNSSKSTTIEASIDGGAVTAPLGFTDAFLPPPPPPPRAGKGISWAEDDLLVADALSVSASTTETQTADCVETAVKDNLGLGRGGTKLNGRLNGGSSTTPSALSGASVVNGNSDPLVLPSLSSQLGSWEISGLASADILSSSFSLLSSPDAGASEGSSSSTAVFPPIAIVCAYQQMTLENHTPPLIMQEGKLTLTVKGLLERARAWAATNAASSLPPTMAIAFLDDDGEDITDCVCSVTVDELCPSTSYELSILPFEMEGSCCEVRIRVSVTVPSPTRMKGEDADADDNPQSASAKETPSTSLVEFTSRPFFVRPSLRQLAAAAPPKSSRSKKSSAALSSSAATDLAAAAAEFVSPYSQDSCSSKFWTRDYLTPSDKIENGFIDPGRANHLLDPDGLFGSSPSSNSSSNVSLRRRPSGSDSSHLMTTLKEREVLLIDEDKDTALQQWVATSRGMVGAIMDTRARVTALAWFVSAVYGGIAVTDDAFDASMAKLRFGRDTRRRGAASLLSSVSGGGRTASASVVVKQSANTLRIGTIPIGLCRHRALLFKYLCDRNGLLCYLVRGVFKEEEAQTTETKEGHEQAAKFPPEGENGNSTASSDENLGSRHSWCVVLTGGCTAGDGVGGKEMLLVDCTHPTEPVQTWPRRGYTCPELPAHVQPIIIDRKPEENDSSAVEGEPAEPAVAKEKKDGVARHCFFAASTHEQIPVRQEDVGRGAVAVVHRATFGGLSCALKIPHCADDEEDLRREYAILTLFRQGGGEASSASSSASSSQPSAQQPHVNNGIVQCLGWCDGLILEYMPFSLLGFMNSLLLRRMVLKGAQIREVLTALCKALTLVHSKGYVHRDVKTENVLLYPERCGDCMRTGVVCPHCSLVAKLADFADCCQLPPQPTSPVGGGGGGSTSRQQPPLLVGPLPVVGTVPYAAPEVEAEVPFGVAADVWSMGILAVELFLMRMPMPFTSGVTGRFITSPYLPEPAVKKSSKKSSAPSPTTTTTSYSSAQQVPSNKVFVPYLDPKSTPSWGVAFVEGCLRVRMEDRLSCDQLLKLLEDSR